MRWYSGLIRTVRGEDRSPEPVGEGLPELAAADWAWRVDELTRVRFWSLARRLPQLVAEALGWGWRASRIDTALAVALTAAAGVFTAFGLLVVQDVLAALFAAGPTVDRVAAAVPALALVAAVATARGGLSAGAGWAQARLEPQVERAAERRLYEASTAAGLAAFDDDEFSNELDRARDRGTMAVRLLVDHAVNLVTGLVGVIAVAVTLWVLHPVLLPALLIASVPGAWAAVRAARVEYVSLYRRTTRRRRLWMLAVLMANRHAAAEVRAYQMRPFLLGEYDRVMDAETRASLKVADQQTAVRAIGGVAGGIAAAAVYGVLGWLLATGAVPLAAAGAAFLALQAGRASLQLLITNVNGVYEEGLYVGDLDAFCARAATHTPKPRAITTLTPPRRIEVTALGFQYPGSTAWALQKVSLTVDQGQTIALVGENGSGKTSLAKLLAGLYEPTRGSITWDGVDLAAVDVEAVREHVAVMHQDWWKWPFTAGQNITLGRWDRRDGAPTARDAAHAVDAHEMITNLPRGYDTLLDRTFKDGHDLSGGQWQRLVAARAIYRDAPVLICDEPSASLDAKAEHALFQHLRLRAGAATTILITHRLANVRHADHIYVLHKGAVVEQGDHDQLLHAGGRYATLFALQAAGYLPDPSPNLAAEPS